jgi:hypothetical protein
MQQQIQFNVSYYVTSSFALLPLTGTTSIVAAIVGGVIKLVCMSTLSRHLALGHKLCPLLFDVRVVRGTHMFSFSLMLICVSFSRLPSSLILLVVQRVLQL